MWIQLKIFHSCNETFGCPKETRKRMIPLCVQRYLRESVSDLVEEFYDTLELSIKCIYKKKLRAN